MSIIFCLGYQRARSDLVSWIRGRRGRNISRAELLNFLTRDFELETRVDTCPVQPSDPASQHALLQLFESSRLDNNDSNNDGGGRKRSNQDDTESEMESPQSKKSRFL